MYTRLKSIDIAYQTAGIIPPPYAHRYTLKAAINRAGELSVQFSISYIDRQELTEDEILGEGFTADDDFAWEGTLLPAWTQALTDLLEKTDFQKTAKSARDDENQFWLSVETADGPAGPPAKPRNRDAWEYFSQELIQAIYETAKVEAPLKLIYLRKDPKNQDVQLEMNVFFSKRTVRTQMQVGNLKNAGELGWDVLNPILKLIYAGEFLAEKASPAPPDRSGRYLSLGDGLWYEFGTSLVNPAGNNAYLTQVQERLDGLAKE